MVKALLLDKKNQSQAPATIKAVEESCVTCGDTHSHRNCPATVGNVYRDNIQEYVSQAAAANYNQGNTGYRPSMVANQIRPPSFPLIQQNQRNNQNRWNPNQNQNRGNGFNQGQLHRPQVSQPPSYQAPAYQAPAPQTHGVSKADFESYVKANDAAYPPRLVLPYTEGLLIPTTSSSPSKVVERETEVTKDIVLPTNNGSTKDVQPPVVQDKTHVSVSEPIVAPVSAPMPNPKPSIPYPSRRNDERHPEKANDQIEKFYEFFRDMSFEISFADALILMPKFASTLKALIGNKEKLSEMARTPLNEHCSAKKLSLPELTPTCMTLELADHSISRPIGIAEDVSVKTSRALIDVYEGELTLRVGKEAITFQLDQTSRYSANYNDMTANRIDVVEMACEEYSQEVIGFSDMVASGNPSPYYDPIVSTSSPTLTPFEGSDYLLIEEVDAFLALEDDPTSPEVDDSYYDSEGDILFLKQFLMVILHHSLPTKEIIGQKL
ncbi:hypothetical protein Tco_0614002, partial [Tanacetum coccineum]